MISTAKEAAASCMEWYYAFCNMGKGNEKSVLELKDAAILLNTITDHFESAQPKWISVEDELPKRWRENDKEQTLINYQIYSPEYGVDVGNYLKPAGVWVIMGLPVKVTHWMPLPEPPKEDA